MDAMKRFEEKLAENIARAFDAYQEPVDEQAFARLQARLRERRRRVFWLPLYYRLAAAAAVLGIAGLAWALWPDRPAARAAETPLTAAAEPEAGAPWQETAPAPLVPPALPPAGQDAVQASSHPAPRAPQSAGLSGPGLPKEALLAPPAVPGRPEWSDEAAPAALAEAAQIAAEDTPAGQEDLPAAADSTLEAIAAAPVAEPEARAAEPAPGPLPALADSAGIWSEAARIAPARRRATVELLASAGGNIAEQQLASGMGWRAGLLYHRPLSPALSLSSGLLFAHNRMSFAPASQLDLQRAETLTPNQTMTASNTQQEVFDRQIAARYSSLELPLNIRYAWRQKSGKHWYASLGLSSLWYLRQGFEIEQDVVTTNFFQDPNSLEPTFTVERETVLAQERPAPLRTIDLAGLVNASLAFPFDLGGRSLWVEPYLQVPTGRLTARQFAFGSGGVSLKYALAKPK
jgi:hypothetical protein